MVLSTTWTERELLQRLQRNTAGAVLVTSTLRAARAWRALYNEAQKQTSRIVWQSPQILAWDPWLRSLWNTAILAGAETRVLLSPMQELHLWQKVLEQDAAAQRTLSFSGLAELAQQAFQELASYGISLQQLRGDSSPDAQAFHAWSVAFLAQCRKLSCMPAAQMDAALGNVIASGKIKLPEEVFLLGFDRTTPSQDQLIAALQASHCDVHSVELRAGETPANSPHLVCARTLDEEIACAAHWIRRELLSRPEQRIGVLVPSSAEMRDKIDRTFRAILAPSTMDIRTPPTAMPYEFSLGTIMAHTQAVRTALTLLRWLYEPIRQDDVSWLLVHGGFSSATLDARATLDRRFRERSFQLGGSISFADFRQWIADTREKSESEDESASLRKSVHTLFAKARRNAWERTQSFTDWRELIEELLADAEFHLLDPATSEDHQLLQRWNTVLNEFSSLDAVGGPVRFSAALEKLDHLAAQTLFALETTDAPVQVLGIPESAGLVFDAVWWMSAQASDWPPRGKAQSFIPWNLQRAVHMPYADPGEDDLFAQRVTRRILNSSGKVVVSFALQNSDPSTASSRVPDREIVLSPLVRQALPENAILAAEEFIPLAANSLAGKRGLTLETMQDEPAVPLLANSVRGGVRFLELQSACPFRAFAETRLGTRPLQETGTGLDAAAQGTLMHRVLQTFWQEMDSQENLLRSAVAEQRQILRKHIAAALQNYAGQANQPWQRALLQTEAQRVEDRLLLWLEREKTRQPFTVNTTEDRMEDAELAGISFQCRVDRIDTTQQGAVLLDYKTGCVSANDCAGDRPDQPQLPAYAILRDERSSGSPPIAGIAFASLRPQKIGFTVVAAQPFVLTQPTGTGASRERARADALSPEEMHEQIAEWKITLARLAEQFRSGNAVVDPKKGRSTCTYCKQALLCRIGEAGGSATSLLEEEHGLSMEGLGDN